MAESGDEVKDMEFDRADVNALKKRLRDNKLPHLTPSEERRLAAEEKARKEAEERARRAAKEKARLEAEARALAEAPRGSFSFKPEAVSLKLKEGVEAPAKIAVSFALLPPAVEGGELPEWWAAPAPVAVAAKDDGSFDLENSLLGQTKRFLLSEKSLKGLLGMSVEVSLLDVKGEVADAATDPKLGTATVPLRTLLVDELPEYRAELALGAYDEPVNDDEEGEKEGGEPAPDASEGPLVKAGSTSTLTVLFTCDDDMTDYALGGCILTCSGVDLTSPPPLWVDIAAALADGEPEGGYAADEKHAKIAELVEGGALGEAKQTITLALKDGAPIPPIGFSQGVLSYVPPPPTEQSEVAENAAAAEAKEGGAAAEKEDGGDKEEGEGEGDAAPPKPFVMGTWKLTFAQPEPIFLTRASRFSLKVAIADGDPLELLLTRSMTPAEEGGSPPEPDWVLLVQMKLDDLLIEDATSASAKPITICSAPVPEDLMADELELLQSFQEVRAANLEAALHPTASAGDGKEEGGEEKEDGGDAKEAEAAAPLPEALSASASIALSRPLRKSMSGEKVLLGLTSADVVPSRRVIPTKPPRNFEQELRTELGDIVQLVAAEYVRMFPAQAAAANSNHFPSGEAALDDDYNAVGDEVKEPTGMVGRDGVPISVGRELQEKQLLYVLNSTGLYHEFKERLKPRLQRVVRSRFDAQPDSPGALDRDITELYSFLMKETATVLNGTFTNAQHAAVEPQVETPPGLLPVSQEVRLNAAEEALEKLAILANDAEANGDWATAFLRHEDRVATAAKALGPTTDGPGAEDAYAKKDGYFGQYKTIVADTWFLFGRFCMRAAADAAINGDGSSYEEYLGKAAECLGTATIVDDEHVPATRLCGAVLLEQGKYEKSAVVLQRALDLEIPAPAPSDDQERSDDSLAAPEPLSNVLMCLQLMLTGQPIPARSSLGYAVLGFGARGGVAPGKPKRTAVLLAIQTAEYLVESALPGLATKALELADKAEASAKTKAMERGLVSTEHSEATPRSVLQLKHRVGGRLALMNRDFEVAAERAQGACDLCGDEDAASWVALGDVAHATNRIEDAAEAYGRAVSVANAAAPPEVPELRTLVRLGALCLQLSRTDAAKDVFLQGASAWQCCSMWLGAGIAFLRLGALGDSEAALQEANVRNNENAVVWGYICLLCLNVGEARLEQANRAQAVAARLGLADSTLLRELANAYTEIDRFDTAEELFRRSLAVDEGSAHTRRRLADVLSAQNAVADAVNEYMKVIDAVKERGAGDAVEKKEALAAIDQCEKLLQSLGRANEIKPLLELKQTLA